MEFELSKQQKEIQKAVRDFVKGEFDKELIQSLDEKHDYPVDIWKKAAELGFIGIHFPEAYSGQGFGVMENILVAEELCRGDSSVGACLLLAGFASEIVLHFGSESQKATWLPKVAEGEVLSCGAFTEPDHGSDITTMATTAVKDGDEWVINGAKVFITNGGPLAGFYSVLCQTDPDASPSHRGLSLILVEADRPGVSTQSVGHKMGIRMMDTAEVIFKDVRVPLDNLIGKEGRGFYQVLEFLTKAAS
ncbi:acyl-CoA dehydrogenase family protein [Desulfosarcina cetonica]|uniref:acyl-CoA dehydrogenase family protein n=1 Tax=Desulfosarcina cetonica TaxID=90730 RepID=UPI000AACA8E4|nr:acyl-CoA dehydrogenase family protein [Desulfosarcina cetonica]